MNRPAYIYVTAVTLTAILVLINQPWTVVVRISAVDAAGIAAFAMLGVFAEVMAIRLSVASNRQINSSIAFLPLLACAILFHPTIAILVAGLVELFVEMALRGRVYWRVAFNTSQAILTIAASTAVAALLGAPVVQPFELDLVAFAGLAGTFFSTNMMIVGGLYAYRQRQRFFTTVGQLVGPRGGNVLYGILSSPIALLTAYLYDRFYIGGIILVILPLLLIRYSYLSKLQLEQANKDLLRVLIKTIETRDPYTSGHSLRVSKIAGAIARDLGLSRRRVEQIETAALLHDVGKIDMIYASIIQKPTRLTDDESRIIKTHAVKGAELLESLTSFPDEVIRGVRHHHERYDGRGYPDGLVGKEIPLASRVIMLCDSIDAMLSDRPYRAAMSVEQVADEIVRCSGTQFDPDIVDSIIRRGTLERAAELVGDDALSFDPGFQILQNR